MSTSTDLQRLDERDQMMRFVALAEHVDVLGWVAGASRDRVERMLTRIEKFSELWAESAPDIHATIESDVHLIRQEMLDQTNTVIELATIVHSAVAMLDVVRRQRDDLHTQIAARPDAGQMYDRFVALLAAHGDLTPEDAQRAAYILFSPDADVMTYDVVDGLDALTRFREMFREIVDELKTRRIER